MIKRIRSLRTAAIFDTVLTSTQLVVLRRVNTPKPNATAANFNRVPVDNTCLAEQAAVHSIDLV
ncbi:hypothetical protein XI05_19235 [Bradyrhizobium sp. CCBAU 11357]|nr:hypothetical protein [Bradyrhizobium sp. CCBAU 11357]